MNSGPHSEYETNQRALLADRQRERIAELEAEVERLRAERDLAIAIVRSRDRLTWNPRGYWIDHVIRGPTIEEAIEEAAKAAEEEKS